MIESLKARWVIILTVLAISIIWTAPNFIDVEKIWWPTKSKMVLGLDIQGGSHLVLRVDVDSAIRTDATRLSASIPTDLNEDKVPVKAVTLVDPLRGHMRVELNKAEDSQPVAAALDKLYGNTFRVLETNADAVVIEYSELHLRDFKNKLLDQAIATIRNRID